MSTWEGSRLARRVVPWVLLSALAGVALYAARPSPLRRADFVFNNSVEIATLDPATVTGIPEGRILRAIYEGLVVLHPRSLDLVPGQAESWEISEDGLVYTFYLRPDATWSNGDPVTARDFLFSWRRLLSPQTAAEYAYQLWYVRGAEDYSTWPADVYSTLTAWARPLANPRARAAQADAGRAFAAGDRVRIGLTPGVVREAHQRGRLERLELAPIGADVQAGGAFGKLTGKQREIELASPVSGRVLARNEARLSHPRGLEAEVFGNESWLVELALDERGAAELAALPRGEVWREEHLWPEVGIRALDDLTLEVELAHPTPFFLELTAFYPLYPVHPSTLLAAKKRWPRTWQVEWVKPENLVTNGPYRVFDRRVNDRIRLVKNPAYWDADSVAFRTIDALSCDHYGTALNLYLTGACDWLNGTIPSNLVTKLLEREDFAPSPYLGSYFYRVNVTKPPLDDVNVRRALAMAIDRTAICAKITKAGQRPLLGLVPPGMRGYASATFGEEDVERARILLAQAGFGPGGRPFPPLEILYNTSETHRDIAEVIADGWRRDLGIDAQLLNQEWKVYLDTERTQKYDVSRGSWIADYADPNTFLDLFVTDGENNRTGWSNADYDDLVGRAAREPQAKQRMQLLLEAEKILMRELPILPIYSYTAQNLVNPRLGGFFDNVQDVHFPKFWYWKSDEELRERRVPPKKIRVDAPGPRAGLYSPRRRQALAETEPAGRQDAQDRGNPSRLDPPRPQGSADERGAGVQRQRGDGR